MMSTGRGNFMNMYIQQKSKSDLVTSKVFSSHRRAFAVNLLHKIWENKEICQSPRVIFLFFVFSQLSNILINRNVIIVYQEGRFCSLYYYVLTHIQTSIQGKTSIPPKLTHYIIIRMVLVRPLTIFSKRGLREGDMAGTKRNSMKVNHISNIINNISFPTRSSILTN